MMLIQYIKKQSSGRILSLKNINICLSLNSEVVYLNTTFILKKKMMILMILKSLNKLRLLFSN